MAGRIRSIKPELIEDAVTAGLSHEAFRLFVAMIVMADDHGNLGAAPAWLQGQVFHGRPITLKKVKEACAELAKPKPGQDEGLVVFYEVGGQSFAHLTGWSKHQRVDNAMAPRIPLPPGWEAHSENRSEGGRQRVRWIVRRIQSTGAAPPPSEKPTGAAPPPSETPDGAAQTPLLRGGGAARSRSPITDHRSPMETGAAPPPAASASELEVSETAGQLPESATDLDRSTAELLRVAMFRLRGQLFVASRVKRLVDMAEGQGAGRRPIAPYVQLAVDKLASKLLDGDEPMKPSEALSWVITTAEGMWHQRKLDAPKSIETEPAGKLPRKFMVL